MWPHRARETPPAILELMDHVGRHMYGSAWLGPTALIETHRSSRGAALAVPTADLDDLDVRYFVDHNPESTLGKALPVAMKIDVRNLASVLRELARQRSARLGYSSARS
jgi:hypothetical protein